VDLVASDGALVLLVTPEAARCGLEVADGAGPEIIPDGAGPDITVGAGAAGGPGMNGAAAAGGALPSHCGAT